MTQIFFRSLLSKATGDYFFENSVFTEVEAEVFAQVEEVVLLQV